jgi:hypothetical protein
VRVVISECFGEGKDQQEGPGLLREPWPQGGKEPRKTGLALPRLSWSLIYNRQRRLTLDEAKVDKREERAVERPRFEEPVFGDLRTFRSAMFSDWEEERGQGD